VIATWWPSLRSAVPAAHVSSWFERQVETFLDKSNPLMQDLPNHPAEADERSRVDAQNCELHLTLQGAYGINDPLGRGMCSLIADVTVSTGFVVIAYAAIAAMLMVVLVVLFDPGLRYKISAASSEDNRSDDFLGTLEVLTDSKWNGSTNLVVLRNAPCFYEEELMAIATAQNSACLEAHIFQESEIAQRFVDALAEAHAPEFGLALSPGFIDADLSLAHLGAAWLLAVRVRFRHPATHGSAVPPGRRFPVQLD